VGDTGHDPMSCLPTFDVDVAVIGIAAEFQSPSCEFLIQFVEHLPG